MLQTPSQLRLRIICQELAKTGNFPLLSEHTGELVKRLVLGQAELHQLIIHNFQDRFDFYPDRLLDPYVATQGILGIVESFPADNSIIATCSIAAEEAGVRIIG